MAIRWMASSITLIFTLGCLTTYTWAKTNAKCIDYTKHIHHHHKTEAYQTNVDPKGVWVSSRCEIVRGEGKALMHGKYVYRRFKFENGKWRGLIHHYSDSWCTKPSFTVKFEGHYDIYQRNFSTYDISLPANFQFTKIKYISKYEEDIKDFLSFMTVKCADALPSYMKESQIEIPKLVNKEIGIEDYVLRKKHCRFYLAIHPYSYKKIRMVRDTKRSTKYSTLYFGDIPKFTTPKMHSYKSPSFQYGLSRTDRPWCNVCKLGDKVDDEAPILPAPSIKDDLDGEWVTEACTATEERSYNTMQYTFEDEKFSVYQVDFHDQNCRRKTLAVKFGGTYEKFNTDGEIDGLLGVRMTSKWMKITFYDANRMNVVLNSRRCGNSKEWELGKEQDVTSTKGCFDLTYQELPIIEDHIVRAATFGRKRELYITPYEEGIKFDTNLVTCDSVTSEIVLKRTTRPPATQPPQTTFSFVSLPKDDKTIIHEQIEKTLRNEMNKDKNNKGSPAKNLIASLVSVCLCFIVTIYMFGV